MIGLLVAVTLLAAALSVFLAYSVYLVIVHRQYAHIPQPKGASFYSGHAIKINQWMNSGNFFHDLLIEWFNELGPVYVIWLLFRPTLIVANSECVQALSARGVSKARVLMMEHVFGQRFLYKGIITIPSYDEWKGKRRRFDASFTRSHLNDLVPMFNKVAREHLIANLRSRADGQTVVDLMKEFAISTLQMISLVAFGTDFSQDQYVMSVAGEKGLLYLMSHSLEGVTKQWMNPAIKYMRFGRNRSYAEAALKVRQIGEYCIRRRLAALENKQEVPNDILTLILQTVQTENKIDMDELVDDFVSFYVAGQETTSNLLSFCFILLQQHPDVWHRVMEEIDEVVGDKTSVEAGDLDKLTYMNQVMEEALRMYPPGAAISKEVPSGGMTLCGHYVPSGTKIMISTYAIHHMPEYYDEPSQFRPSRFSPDQKRPSPYMFMPFGIGHRSCIGRVFAMMEAKVLMVHLLRTYQATLVDNYKLELEMTLTVHPKGGVPCTLLPRDHKN